MRKWPTTNRFPARNGLVLSTSAEKKLASGALITVPDVGDLMSTREVRDWNSLAVKPYKIRILRPDDKEMDVLCELNSKNTWNELDKPPVAFKSDYRPRSRYLFHVYLRAVGHRAYLDETRSTAFKNSLGEKYNWGACSSYMKRCMIKPFIEELGYNFESLRDGPLTMRAPMENKMR